METKVYDIIDGVEKLAAAIARTRKAQQLFATYTQEQVDKIFLAAATAANKARIELAKLCIQTGRSTEAERLYREVLRIKPGDSYATEGLARLRRLQEPPTP